MLISYLHWWQSNKCLIEEMQLYSTEALHSEEEHFVPWTHFRVMFEVQILYLMKKIFLHNDTTLERESYFILEAAFYCIYIHSSLPGIILHNHYIVRSTRIRKWFGHNHPMIFNSSLKLRHCTDSSLGAVFSLVLNFFQEHVLNISLNRLSYSSRRHYYFLWSRFSH